MLEEAGMSFPGQAELQRYHNMFLKSANYSSLGVQLYLSLLIKSIISNAKNCNLIHELYGEEILWWFGASCSCKARVGNSWCPACFRVNTPESNDWFITWPLENLKPFKSAMLDQEHV